MGTHLSPYLSSHEPDLPLLKATPRRHATPQARLAPQVVDDLLRWLLVVAIIGTILELDEHAALLEMWLNAEHFKVVSRDGVQDAFKILQEVELAKDANEVSKAGV